MLLQVAHDERALRHDGFAAGGDIRHGLPDEFGSEPAAREGRIDLGVGKDEAALLVGDQEFDSAKTFSAFALGLALFLITLALNVIALRLVRRYKEQYE